MAERGCGNVTLAVVSARGQSCGGGGEDDAKEGVKGCSGSCRLFIVVSSFSRKMCREEEVT